MAVSRRYSNLHQGDPRYCLSYMPSGVLTDENTAPVLRRVTKCSVLSEGQQFSQGGPQDPIRDGWPTTSFLRSRYFSQTTGCHWKIGELGKNRHDAASAKSTAKKLAKVSCLLTLLGSETQRDQYRFQWQTSHLLSFRGKYARKDQSAWQFTAGADREPSRQFRRGLGARCVVAVNGTTTGKKCRGSLRTREVNSRAILTAYARIPPPSRCKYTKVVGNGRYEALTAPQRHYTHWSRASRRHPWASASYAPTGTNST